MNTPEWVIAAGMQANSEGFWSQRDAANKVAFAAWVGSDANDRFEALASGQLQWGPGNAAPDTNLYRMAAGALMTDGEFYVAKDFVANYGQSGQVFVPPYARPTIEFSPSRDTDVFRQAAGILGTSGKFNALGGLQINGVDLAPLPDRIGQLGLLLSGNDFNTAVYNGWYWNNPSALNAPPGGPYFGIHVINIANNPGYATQFAYDYGDNAKVWKRLLIGGVWGAWAPFGAGGGPTELAYVERTTAFQTSMTEGQIFITSPSVTL